MTDSLDLVSLNFNKDALLLLNCCLAYIMFGVALDLKIRDFQLLIKSPVNVVTGLICQLLLLPAATLGLILLINPGPGIALGMMLVASCPGGNVSNFFSAMAKGNIALSVSMTAITSLGAVVITPLNFAFWSQMHGPSQKLITAVNLDINSIILTILLVLVVPMAAGLMVNERYPRFSERYRGIIRKISIAIFSLFIIGALAANYRQFLEHILDIAGIVFLHNGAALLIGFTIALLIGLPKSDRKTISIETGIQNSGLALVLIFDFFHGLGGMAIIAAWWGVWHLISGMLLSYYWSTK